MTRILGLLLAGLLWPTLLPAQTPAFTEAVAVPRTILEEAAHGFGTTDFQVHYVDSRGIFRDFFARLARGGEEADRLRQRLEEMSESGGGRLLVYSTNPGLAYTVLKSSLPDADASYSLEGVTLGYAGLQEYGDKLCEAVCTDGGSFVFIDTGKGITREPTRSGPAAAE